MFEDAGFPSVIPIIYWNLRSTKSAPIASKDTVGVTLLAGFSAGLLKTVLGGNLAEFSPIAQLNAILNLPAYAGLKVVEDE
jgi:hypothetical protein